MRAIKSAVPLALLAVMSICSGASAESTADAIKTFALIGTWSKDCAKDPLKGGSRYTFSVSMLGTVTSNSIESVLTGTTAQPSYVISKQEIKIRQAVRVTEEKIKIISAITSWTLSKDDAPTSPIYKMLETLKTQIGEREFEDIIIKTDGKIKTIESASIDGKIILISNGHNRIPEIIDRVSGKVNWMNSSGTGNPVALDERCLN